MAKDILKVVKKKIHELTEKKQSDLAKIQEKKTDAIARKEAAEDALKEATEQMDLEKFKEAENRVRNAEVEISMYSGRLEQIKNQSYISEIESDEVIDSILQFENDLEKDFRDALAEKLLALDTMLTEYRETVQDAETTIATWTGTIHANYRSRGVTIYSATGTDRSPDPIPVRRYAYIGCKEATTTRDFLERMKDLYKVIEE